MYSAAHVRPTYQFLLSYDYRLLSYKYWIFDHIFVIWNSHCACAVSRDLRRLGALSLDPIGGLPSPRSPGPAISTTWTPSILKSWLRLWHLPSAALETLSQLW